MATSTVPVTAPLDEPKQVLEQYKTFWERFWAGFFDGIVFIPIFLAIGYFLDISSFRWKYEIHKTLFILLPIAYSVSLHTLYGQTIGKRIMGVKVFDVSESRLPNLKQAFLRDIGLIAIAIATLAYMFYSLHAHQDIRGHAFKHRLPNQFVSWTDSAWFWLEIITMFFSKKRRALHDLIAGTVVRLD